MSESRTELLGDLLKATSRSFYLTLRVLPAAVRSQIGLAYLLARTTDTVADTEIVSLAQRLEALRALRERIAGQGTVALNFGELARKQGLPAERVLLEKVEASLALLATLSPADLTLVRAVLATIISGQELDLQRFGRGEEAAAGLTPENLLEVRNETVFLPLFRGYLDLAEGHLDAGWRYTNTLPFGQFRVRLACSWPVLFGLRTVVKLRAAGAEGLRQRVKITRGEVRGILFRSLLASPFPGLWRGLDDSAGRRGK